MDTDHTGTIQPPEFFEVLKEMKLFDKLDQDVMVKYFKVDENPPI